MTLPLFDFIPPAEFFSAYIFRTMLIGTVLIGCFSGAMGCLLYLRKQALVSDVIGHSSILGVVVAFTVASVVFHADGRSLTVLVIGAAIAATLAAILTNVIVRISKIKADAAMAICLSLFYGGGMVGMRMLTHSSLPNRGGIESYMFGNAANLRGVDVRTILIFGALVVAVLVLAFKEIKLLLFDPISARVQGFSPRILDPLIIGIATLAIVIWIKGVGLILMVAFAIMPAAAARQWTNKMSHMIILAGVFGGLAGGAGAYVSVCLGKVPTGPVVVLCLFTAVLFSLFFAPQRSVFAVARRRRRLQSAGAKEER